LPRYNGTAATAALALDATARSYGYTDDEIAASYRRTDRADG
jgi:hypothetical protein